MKNVFVCGSVESSDVLITYTKNDKPLKVTIQSKVIHQFGDEIKKIVDSTCKENNIKTGELDVNDQGAIPPVIKSRILGVISKMNGVK